MPRFRQPGLREVGTSGQALPRLRSGFDQVELGVQLAARIAQADPQPARALKTGQPPQQRTVQLRRPGLHGAQDVGRVGVGRLGQELPVVRRHADQEQQLAVGCHEVQPIEQARQAGLGNVADADQDPARPDHFVAHEAVDRAAGVVHEGERNLRVIGHCSAWWRRAVGAARSQFRRASGGATGSKPSADCSDPPPESLRHQGRMLAHVGPRRQRHNGVGQAGHDEPLVMYWFIPPARFACPNPMSKGAGSPGRAARRPAPRLGNRHWEPV